MSQIDLLSGHPRLRALALALTLCIAAACGAQDATRTSSQAGVKTVPPESTSQALPDFTALVEQYGDAVVDVVSTREISATSAPQVSPDDPFYEFFRRFGIPAPEGEAPPVQQGQGSGFIVSKDGYVLTNAHVVNEATRVTVRLPDRREFGAKVIGTDTRTDVAVLKIDATDLPTVKVGDPDAVRAGEWVIAIGAPFGFGNSVTAGIVSATKRTVGPESSIVPFIQTDVAVNPGNSGGPLFNLRGEVIGMNSMIYSATGGYMGVSFAIPIDVALDVQRQLVETGRVTRGRIGVAIQDVNAQLAESFGLDRPRGALVASVDEDGPAKEAGLQPGDVILSVEGQEVERSGDLATLIADRKPGTEATLEIWRNRKPQRVEVRIAELEDPEAQQLAARPGGGKAASAPDSRLGLAVRPLTPQEQKAAETEGTLIVEQATGAAASAGIQRGDIILRVGTSPVKSVEELRKATEKAKSTVALLIERDGAQIYVPIRLG